MMSWPVHSIEWMSIYKIKEEEHIYETVVARLNTIYSIIKNMDINTKELKGIGNMREFIVLILDEETMNIIRYCTELTQIMDEKYGDIFRKTERDEDQLAETIKKIGIFYRSMSKMKLAQ